MRPHEAAYTAMLLPTIKPVYSGTYATGCLKTHKKCMLQAHEVQEAMQGNIKVDRVLSYSSFHETFGDIEAEAHVFVIWTGV